MRSRGYRWLNKTQRDEVAHYACALSCWKVPSTGLTTLALSSILCNAPLQKALNLEKQKNMVMQNSQL